MSDHAFTDEFGYPLSSLQALQRRRRKVPLRTGASQRAAFGEVPASVHQLAEAAEAEKERKE